MKLNSSLCVLLGMFVATAPALASPELAEKKNCTLCHSVDKKGIGPSFKDVAAKYASDKEAVAKLSAKVIKGGSGVWGDAVMPPNPVSEAEAKQLVTWVLQQK